MVSSDHAWTDGHAAAWHGDADEPDDADAANAADADATHGAGMAMIL